VVAIQHGKAIFSLSASFQVEEKGADHAESMPAVPGPETLPTFGAWVRGATGELEEQARLPRPIDVRYITPPPWAGRDGVDDGHSRVWMRADGALPDDRLLHVCMVAFASDLTLLGTVLERHGVYWGPTVTGASLDHAMWFHRPFRADEWLLYDCASPTASGARGLATGRFFSRDGHLVATVVQEGLLRVEH
jgi:acyl-CoA thioesterase-2